MTKDYKQLWKGIPANDGAQAVRTTAGIVTEKEG